MGQWTVISKRFLEWYNDRGHNGLLPTSFFSEIMVQRPVVQWFLICVGALFVGLSQG
jgi:hypothetical protein